MWKSKKFNFQSLEFQPYLAHDLSSKKIAVQADYGLMLYSRRLTDDEHTQGFKSQRPYIVGNGLVKWAVASSHSLTFIHTLSVKHPSYLQVCWFDRTSDYCVLNAKISKSFKKVTLFLEGRDLADWSHESRVESADGSTVHIEMSYFNRRVVLLGCKWVF